MIMRVSIKFYIVRGFRIKYKAMEVKSEGDLYDDNALGDTSENRVNASSLKIV